MKKFISMVLALVLIVFGSYLTAFAAEETPVSIAGDNLGRGKGLFGITIKSNADGSITSPTSNISFYLPEPVKGNETVTVHVKGSSKGDFRMWLIDVNETTNSNIYQMSQNGFTSGDFDKTFDLTATKDATEFFFKAPTYDGKVDNLTVTYLSVTKKAAEAAATETKEKAADVKNAAAKDSANDTAAKDATAATTAAATETVPKTGVKSNAALYIGLMAVTAFGYVVMKKKMVKK